MNLTEHYSLQKPISEEKYSVNVTNMNMDLIDSALNRIEQRNMVQDDLLATKESVNGHISDKANPHEVTKSQIGLGNVDNTPDMEKPVSFPQQAVLDDSISIHNTSDSSHDDIRLLISNLASNKVNVSDIIHDLTSMQENVDPGKCIDALVVKEVFQSVSNGKELIASAITDKGVQTDAKDTFEIMANNINEIEAGSSGNYPIPSPYVFNLNWNKIYFSPSGTYSLQVPFPIKKVKKMLIKKLYVAGEKLSTSNSANFAFRFYGIKKGNTSENMIRNYDVMMNTSTTSLVKKADITNEEIDLSEYEEITKCELYNWGRSGTVITYYAVIQFDAELYY